MTLNQYKLGTSVENGIKSQRSVTSTRNMNSLPYRIYSMHIFLIGIGSKLSMKRNMSQGSVTQNFCKSYSIQRRYSILNISLYAQPAMKTFLRMLRQQWNIFRVCSASDEIHSAYAQHILNYNFEMGVISPYAEQARK